MLTAASGQGCINDMPILFSLPLSPFLLIINQVINGISITNVFSHIN